MSIRLPLQEFRAKKFEIVCRDHLVMQSLGVAIGLVEGQKTSVQMLHIFKAAWGSARLTIEVTINANLHQHTIAYLEKEGFSDVKECYVLEGKLFRDDVAARIYEGIGVHALGGAVSASQYVQERFFQL
jgi:hypothetical protein